MSEMFPSLPEPLEMRAIFRTFPNTIQPLLEYHDRLLRDWSPLTIGERELIAAYVSGLNACTYCHGAHALAASAFGIPEEVFETLVADPDNAPINPRMRPLLAYVRKLTLSPSRMSGEDASAVYAAGWDERALFDAISVCALFNFMNRIVEGTGLSANPMHFTGEARQAILSRMCGGNPVEDRHEGEGTYTKLLTLWDVPVPDRR